MTADLSAALDRIEGLAAAATDGPWAAVSSGPRNGDHWYVVDESESIALIHASDGEDEDTRQPDAEFIAAARTDLPRLDAVVRAVLGVNREVEIRIDGLLNQPFNVDSYQRGYDKALDDIRAAATKAWEDGR